MCSSGRDDRGAEGPVAGMNSRPRHDHALRDYENGVRCRKSNFEKFCRAARNSSRQTLQRLANFSERPKKSAGTRNPQPFLRRPYHMMRQLRYASVDEVDPYGGTSGAIPGSRFGGWVASFW